MKKNQAKRMKKKQKEVKFAAIIRRRTLIYLIENYFAMRDFFWGNYIYFGGD